MARQVKPAAKAEDNESLVHAFFHGFFWPVRMIGKGLAWLSHRPPLKQIGHGLRWFFRLKAVRFLGRILGLSYVRTRRSSVKKSFGRTTVTGFDRHKDLSAPMAEHRKGCPTCRARRKEATPRSRKGH